MIYKKYILKNRCLEYFKKKFKKIKFYFLLASIYLIFLSYLNRKKEPSICLCLLSKQENRYLREYIEYYKKKKVDKIFLYDNNDIGDKNLNEFILDYIENGFINVTNYRGKIHPQIRAYQECYNNNYNLYDWFIFYDSDEFIYLKDFKDLKKFLGDKRFINCQRIQINWIYYTDNNLLYYDNRSLEERFTEKEPDAREGKTGIRKPIKSIIRGHNPNLYIYDIHIINKNLSDCDGFGNKVQRHSVFTLKPDYEYYYIKHYYSKSTEEFIDKIMKTDSFYSLSNSLKNKKIKRYFLINKITKEKLDLIETKTKINLSNYRDNIKNS